jgi:hypothetical protein
VRAAAERADGIYHVNLCRENEMLANLFAKILGIFLLVIGVWGLFSPVVLGALTTNLTHAVIEIVLGIVGILAKRRGFARGYLIGVGTLLIVVGVLRFIPGGADLVVSLLNVNYAVAYFNIVVGAICLIVAITSPRAPRDAAPMP